MLRRIIRRAVRPAYLLGGDCEVTLSLVDRAVELMGDAYPDLRGNRDRVIETIAREEHAFRRTLARGSTLLDARLAELNEGESLPGEVAFDLYETHGFPLEVTQEIAAERDLDIDLEGYETALKKAQEISGRKTTQASHYENLTDFQSVFDRFGPTEFVGREELETKANVVAVIGDSVFLDRTPFYAESGGQVGDTGTITTDTGRAEVLDTTSTAPPACTVTASGHRGHDRAGPGGDGGDRRRPARRHPAQPHRHAHPALGAAQGARRAREAAGLARRSRPAALRLQPLRAGHARADREIEDLANEEILANDPVRHYETTKDNAAELGAIAFFGDKYGDIVRVLEAGRTRPSCAAAPTCAPPATSARSRSSSEGSIGSNLRRIEGGHRHRPDRAPASRGRGAGRAGGRAQRAGGRGGRRSPGADRGDQVA